MNTFDERCPISLYFQDNSLIYHRSTSIHMRACAMIIALLQLSFCMSGQESFKRCGTTHIPKGATPIALPHSYPREDIVIPIVFHVVYSSDEENISDELILSQLEVINQDYSSIDPLTDDLPSRFTKSVASPGISFCLAQNDPFGNPSTGIIRHPVNTANIANKANIVGSERVIKDSELGGHTAWDPRRFLNVWIGGRNDGITGDATFPNDPDETETDGIVIDYRVIGRREDESTPFNLGRTLTHEIGHYLNVYHLYGSETGCFNDDDLVEDTPNQFGPYFGQCDDAVSSCGDRDMDTNFMNFRDDNCIFFFTRGQVDRMIETLFTSRYELITSEICNSGKPIPPDPLKLAPILTLANGIEIPLNTLSEEQYSLRLFDVSGRLIWHTSSNESHRYRIDNLGLSTSIYILVLELKDQIFTRKVLMR